MVTTSQELADTLRRASAAKQSVVIRGAGSKSDWPRRTRAADVVISTLGLDRLLAHEHGDLTATIEAGATLRNVNAALARHGQWLPLDPSFADVATIGGILATNDAGSLRHRYGAPRDQVIGIQVATSDGLLAKAGGRVVKNVAGYDLSKLVTGSFGNLAAIASATFKLAPLPRASATLVATLRDHEHAAQMVRDVMASQLEPIAFEIHQRSTQTPHGAHSHRMLLRFASVREAVDAQIDCACRLPAIADLGAPQHVMREGAPGAAVLQGDDERGLWREHGDQIWRAPGAILRASWLPANTAAVLATLTSAGAPMRETAKGGPPTTGDATGERVGCAELVGRAVVGTGLIRIDADSAVQLRTLERLRGSPMLGNLVVLRGADALKDACAVPADQQRLIASLKRAFDPAGILQ
jgi:glycolate oxidase FAD binding subunit